MSVPWSSWPPSQGDVTSVFGRRGAVVAAIGDYRASQVTNDSLVSGVEVSDALNTLATAITAVGNYAGSNPYIAVPATPNAFDDEFSSGSPDLAVRGYTVVDNVSGATLTRSGDIDPLNTTGPAANTYWSTLSGSCLFVQAPAGITVAIYKTIALAAGDTYWARTVGTYCFAPVATGRFNEVGLYAPNGTRLSDNDRAYTSIRDDTVTAYLVEDIARVTASAFGGSTGRFVLGGHDIRGVRFDSGTNYYGYNVGGYTNEVSSLLIAGAPAAATLTRFGLKNVFGTSGGNVPQIWAIDFIRKKTANAWLIP